MTDWGYQGKDVTILIPTMNRSLFMVRALYFYAEHRFGGYVCIGDSSENEDFENTQIAVQELKDRLQVIHRFCPREKYSNEAVVVKELISLAPTKYVCQYGDDDFLIPVGIHECARFLDENDDYVAACGRIRIEFSLEPDSLYFGQMSETIEVKENDFDKESGTERFRLYMGNAVAPTYSLYRKPVSENMYRYTDVAITRYFGPEVLTSAIGAISGKAKLLDVLTLVFQVHEEHIFSWYKQSIYDTIVDPNFSRTIMVIREELAEQLVLSDKIDYDEALQTVDKEMWSHIYKMLSWQYKERYRHSERNPTSFSSWIRTMPGVGQPISISLVALFWGIRKQIRAFRRNLKKKKFTVNNLTASDFPYHGSFTSVYNFLLTPPYEVSSLYQINGQRKK
jgi:glycosyltransferase domain-containing protein